MIVNMCMMDVYDGRCDDHLDGASEILGELLLSKEGLEVLDIDLSSIIIMSF